MAGKTIEQLANGRIIGHAGLGFRSGVAGSVKQQVHDGDTINARAMGNFGMRFLGIDAPEISLPLPDAPTTFRGLSDVRWETYLSNPFANGQPAFDPPLDPGLLAFLQARVGPGTAINHALHAEKAEDALELEVTNDIAMLGLTQDTFQFFLSFAGEVMDRYGRLLAFVNCDKPAEPRPISYNERLLRDGMVSPYFIWPNINPFRRASSTVAAVPAPNTANTLANSEAALRNARQWVSDARQAQRGIFSAPDPLRIEAFEVRFLSRRRPPDRWVIDLSTNDDVLVKPQNYHTIANTEDRLYIPEEFVPLFVEKGWRRQQP